MYPDWHDSGPVIVFLIGKRLFNLNLKRMKRNILFGGLLLLFAACSKDKSVNQPPNNTFVNTVYIRNMSFNPSNARVAFGATVTWVNEDNVTHTVTSDKGVFDSGDIAPGERFSYTFGNTSSTYDYHCEHHPEIKATVIVTGVK